MKRTIKETLFTALLTLMLAGAMAQSQTPKTPTERAAAITAWMKTNLQLTPEQEAPVQALNLKYANLNEPLKTSTATQLEKLKTMRSNEQAKENELKGILTADQIKLYDAKKSEMKAKFKEEMRSRGN